MRTHAIEHDGALQTFGERLSRVARRLDFDGTTRRIRWVDVPDSLCTGVWLSLAQEFAGRIEMRTCALPGCDRQFEANPRGRPQLYCSSAHARRASAARAQIQHERSGEANK